MKWYHVLIQFGIASDPSIFVQKYLQLTLENKFTSNLMRSKLTLVLHMCFMCKTSKIIAVKNRRC